MEPTSAPSQTIWLDADACPVRVKEVLYRVAERRKVRLVLVANAPMRVPVSEHVSFELAPQGEDAADNLIAERCGRDDLVITSDVPLAARIVALGATGMSPRGEFFTEENTGERLAVRDVVNELRSAGAFEGGPSSHRSSDTERFTNALDRYLTWSGKNGG